MTKAELESAHREYGIMAQGAIYAEQAGIYRLVVDRAVAAWQYVDGMLQFEKRYLENDSPNIAAVELVLKYAPVLLDFATLNRLESFLSENRRVKRLVEAGADDCIAEARARMWNAHMIWSELEANPGSRAVELHARLALPTKFTTFVLSCWTTSGLVLQLGRGELSLSTQLGRVVPAKCSSCGKMTEAPKAMLLESVDCPECGQQASFVLLA